MAEGKPNVANAMSVGMNWNWRAQLQKKVKLYARMLHEGHKGTRIAIPEISVPKNFYEEAEI